MCTRMMDVLTALAGAHRHVSIAEPSWERNGATHIGEKKVGEQVNERVRQLSVLLKRCPELFPPNREVVFSFGQFWAWPWLLKYNCGFVVSSPDVLIKTEWGNNHAHHQIPVKTPYAVDLRNHRLANVINDMQHRKNSHQDGIVVDLASAAEGKKEC